MIGSLVTGGWLWFVASGHGFGQDLRNFKLLLKVKNMSKSGGRNIQRPHGSRRGYSGPRVQGFGKHPLWWRKVVSGGPRGPAGSPGGGSSVL